MVVVVSLGEHAELLIGITINAVPGRDKQRVNHVADSE